MSWVAVAIGGTALIGTLINSNAASNAADAQVNAANNASATNWNIYQQTRNDQLPWITTGAAGLGQLAHLLGIAQPGAPQVGQTIDPVASARAYTSGNGYLTDLVSGVLGQNGWVVPADQSLPGVQGQPQPTGYDPATFGSLTKPFSLSDFQADPGYAFRMQQGLEALERSGAAAGSQLSGAQLKAITGFGQGLGAQEYGDAWNRWNTQNTNTFNRFASLAGLGQQANSVLASAGANAGNQIGANTIGAGNAAAAGLVGSGNAWSSGLNNAANAFLQNYYLSNGGWGSKANLASGTPWSL